MIFCKPLFLGSGERKRIEISLYNNECISVKEEFLPQRCQRPRKGKRMFKNGKAQFAVFSPVPSDKKGKIFIGTKSSIYAFANFSENLGIMESTL